MTDSSKLLIPPKLHVGFQKRSDTYTGQLGYVIYTDTQGKKRKTGSWEGWRSKDIPPVDCDNVPTEGFVLNRDVGGVRHSYYSYHGRMEKVRVYDPRNWEFEITVPNLLNILRDCACSPGKGLEGKFVYAWAGQELVLLPVKSEDFRKSAAFTELQAKTVRAKALVPGYTYLTKRQERWVYLGKFEYYFAQTSDPKTDGGVRHKHVFAAHSVNKWHLVYQNDVKAVAEVASDEVVDNLAELVTLHTHTARGSRIVRLFTKVVERDVRTLRYHSETWAYEREPGQFSIMNAHHDEAGRVKHCTVLYDVHVENGVLCVDRDGYTARVTPIYAYAPWCVNRERPYDYRKHQYVTPETRPWREPEKTDLYALLECGAEVPIAPYDMRRD